MPDETSTPAAVFNTWIRTDSSNPNILLSRGVELYKGPQVYKSAILRVIGDRSTGAVQRRQLKLGRYRTRDVGPGYNFDDPDQVWTCTDEQIDRLAALLNETFDRDGHYAHLGSDRAAKSLIEQISSGNLEAGVVSTLVSALAGSPEVADALAAVDGADLLAAAIDRNRHRRGLDQLRQVVGDPEASEQALQTVLQDNWWVFGGRYVGQAARRKLTLLDQFDIPLVRSDGALHVVELKRANVPRLLVEHRNHLAVGPEVHLATAQAMNYLRALDQQETLIAQVLGLDCHRAFATVVIGHSAHAAGFSRSQISEALRTYNSHLARIEVITYEELLAGAEHALALDETSADRDRSDSANADEVDNPPF